MLVPLLICALGLAATASAHPGCSGHEVSRRNHGGIRVPRQAPTDEASGASSVDVSLQCTGYSYEPVASLKPFYPTVWQIASLVPNDNEAASLFQTVNATLNSKLPTDVPHCGVGGNCTMGDFSSFTPSYPATDPDCWWTDKKCTTPAASTGLAADIVSVPEPMTWALGFDDGPNCSHNAFYDYLASQNQKATMFYIGSNVMDWPLQALRGIADGHQICVHTWAHHYMTSLTNEQAFAELYYSRKIIKDILGVTPLCWRPPFGDVDNRIRTIAQSLNLTTIVWGSDTFDWAANTGNITTQDVTTNYQAVIAGAASGTYSSEGAVVLTHELNNFTMGEAMTMLPAIKAAFKYVVPLCAAMNQTHPYVETNITCPNFASYIGGETNVSAVTTNAPTNATTESSKSGVKSGALAVKPAVLGWMLAVVGATLGALAAL